MSLNYIVQSRFTNGSEFNTTDNTDYFTEKRAKTEALKYAKEIKKYQKNDIDLRGITHIVVYGLTDNQADQWIGAEQTYESIGIKPLLVVDLATV